ncbi:MAG: hypothetical protein GX320_07650 [Tissierellia bacterium]|nr:hypothetical protein [Tissierellia bacterium]
MNKFISTIVFVLLCVSIIVMILSYFRIIGSNVKVIVMLVVGILLLREVMRDEKRFKKHSK